MRSSVRRLPINKLVLSAVALLCVSGPVVAAELPTSFPGISVDSRTLRVQQKVEELYERGEYERAMFIYQNELAPIGDKYAQYMIGYMHWTGTGVAEDLPTAVAWLRLAAERSNPEFIAARDQAIHSLGAAGSERSDRIYLQLLQEYSDAVILLGLIRADIESMRPRSDSRITGGSRPLMIFDSQSGPAMSADEHNRRIRKRVENSLELLVRQLDHDGLSANVDDIDIDELETLVRSHVATLVER